MEVGPQDAATQARRWPARSRASCARPSPRRARRSPTSTARRTSSTSWSTDSKGADSRSSPRPASSSCRSPSASCASSPPTSTSSPPGSSATRPASCSAASRDIRPNDRPHGRLRGGRPSARPLASCSTPSTEPTDLYTVTPKSTFDPDLPAVYLAARGRSAGRRRQSQHRPHRHRPDADVDRTTMPSGVDRSCAPDGADADRRFVREHPQDRRGGPRIDRACAPTTCCSPTCATSRRCTTTACRRSCRVRIIAKLVRMPDRQIIGVASFERCVRARADKVPKVVEAFDQALGSVMKRLVVVDAAHAAAASAGRSRGRRYRALSRSGQRRDRQRRLPGRQRRLDGADHRRIGSRSGKITHALSTIDQARSAIALARLPYLVAVSDEALPSRPRL